MHPCSSEVSTCLRNQPYDLVTEDSDREANSLAPLHRAERFSQLGPVSLAYKNTGPSEGRYMKLKYQVPSISSALLRIEVAADNIKFVPKYPPGQVCI